MASRIPFLCDDTPRDPAAAGWTVLCLADGPGATWRISFERPLRALRRQGQARFACVDEKVFDGVALDEVERRLSGLLDDIAPDVAVVSRCTGAAAPLLIALAQRRGVPVAYHLDDDLFAAPRELGAAKFAYYASAARQGVMRDCAAKADLIYCSTRALYYRLGRFGFPTPLVHGPIYCSVEEPMAPYAPKRPRVVGYMGTSGHAADLDLIAPAMEIVMADNPDVRFEAFGSIDVPPRLAALFPDRVGKVAPSTDYEGFLAALAAVGWSVGLAPLARTAFNAVKANTKFIEYASCGIPAVVSSGPVYDSIVTGGAGLEARSTIEWATAITRLLDDEHAAAAQVAAAQRRLRERYGMAAHTEQLLGLFARLKATAATGEDELGRASA